MNTISLVPPGHLYAPLFLSDSNGSPLTPAESEALAFLLPLSRDYPDLPNWFRLKVVPGLRAGTRKLICIERQAQLVAVGIGKYEDSERKICTVRVAPSHFGKGFGLRLFDSLLSWLDTDQPHLTVSELKLPSFERIFDRYGFRHTSSHIGRYVPGVAEVSYNETAIL
ncbi:GNAT family N-acetyltransferase [Bradyrhizobium sp. ARR65]|uniref:GNAT family N-acetyltransferase n=1 Tax=Bradyrhizobium sp. ARR65 TaxID=1040989 RepID=UPI000A074E22|nr:GNAT family N-acetyltransferase [Bradyrhizobium sp. ARR65]